VTPGGSTEMSGVIVGISQPGETVVRHFVPFLARYLASFASDAHGRIGEKADCDITLHVRMPALICTLSSFADHKVAHASGLQIRLIASGTLALLFLLFMPFFPPCRDYAKISRRLARLGPAVPDANLVADRPAARFARANQEKPGPAASVRG
jgi:hypothetical protein